MEVLDRDSLDQVAGGFGWLEVLSFFWGNVDHIVECWQGLSDGFSAGIQGPGGAGGAPEECIS